MKYIDFKALIFGGLLAYLATLIIFIIAAWAKLQFVGPSKIQLTVYGLLWFSFVHFCTNFSAGYIIESISNKKPYVTPLLYGIFMLIISGLPQLPGLPMWYIILSVSITLPEIMAGSYVAFKTDKIPLRKYNLQK